MRRYAFRGFAVVVAAAIAVAVGVLVLERTKRSKPESISTIQVLVDSRLSALADVGVPATSDTIIARTPLYADYAASPKVRAMIATRANVNPLTLSVVANTTETQGPSGGVQSSSYNTAPAPHPINQVSVDATDLLPVITIYARSPSLDGASALVNATVSSLKDAVAGLDRKERVPPEDQMVLRPLGDPENAYTTGTKSKTKSIVSGVATFLALALVGLTLNFVIRSWRRRRNGGSAQTEELAATDDLGSAVGESLSEPLEESAERSAWTGEDESSVGPPMPGQSFLADTGSHEDDRWPPRPEHDQSGIEGNRDEDFDE